MQRFEVFGGTAVSAASLLVIVLFLAASMQPYALKVGQSAAVVSAVLVKLANGDRLQNGLSQLQVDAKLTAVAEAKANDMATKGYFAHVSPDGKDPWYWFGHIGYAFHYAGENLAVDFTDSIDVERAWMNSPAHRKNILDPRYTQIGIATAVGTFEGRRTVFVVQLFGTPAPAQQTVVSTTIPDDPEVLATAKTIPIEAPTRVLGAETEAPAPYEPSLTSEVSTPNPIDQLISSPKNTLRYSYYLFAIFLIVALAYTTRFEMKKHHIRHATAAGGLILLMGVLFMVADYMVFTSPTIPSTAASAQSL